MKITMPVSAIPFRSRIGTVPASWEMSAPGWGWNTEPIKTRPVRSALRKSAVLAKNHSQSPVYVTTNQERQLMACRPFMERPSAQDIRTDRVSFVGVPRLPEIHTVYITGPVTAHQAAADLRRAGFVITWNDGIQIRYVDPADAKPIFG